MILLLFIHFVADFVAQSDYVAINKSRNWGILCLHVTIYAAFFLLYGTAFAAITWLCHLAIDAVTSRVNAKLYQAGQRHWFFVGIGFDQWLHFVTLILTARYLGRVL